MWPVRARQTPRFRPSTWRLAVHVILDLCSARWSSWFWFSTSTTLPYLPAGSTERYVTSAQAAQLRQQLLIFESIHFSTVVSRCRLQVASVSGLPEYWQPKASCKSVRIIQGLPTCCRCLPSVKWVCAAATSCGIINPQCTTFLTSWGSKDFSD